VLAIGLITPEGGAGELGTAFACSRRVALTARHCICDLRAEERVLIQLPGAEPLVARVGLADECLDLALLELEEDLPAAFEPVPVARRSGDLDGKPFLVRGYPIERPYATDRFAIDGNIVDADASYEDGVPGLQLHSSQVGEGFELGGFSGAPVMVRLRTGSAGLRWTAVALIVEGLVRPDGGIGHGGTIFASPLDAAGWPTLDALLTEGVAFTLYHEALIREFAGEYLGSATRRVPFGGRTAELAQLQAWLDAPACPTALVTGGPGAGKSALLAKFAADLDETEGLAVAYVPITVGFGLTEEVTVLRALVTRLAALHGEAPVCADAEEWREALIRYLAAPLDGQRSLVVVLDGLDEATGWRAGRWLLPAREATQVKLLLAARARDTTPGGGWLGELGADAGAVRLFALGPLDEDGIEHVLRSVDLLPSGEPAARVCSTLSQLTGGDALVLSLYLDDALERTGRLTVEALGDRPAGLGGYIDRWWADQSKLWGTTFGKQELTVRLVFNVLTCALGPIERGDLLVRARQHTQIDGDALDDALLTLRRFVIGTAEGWTISHPALAEHRRSKLKEDGDERAVHELFARWGTSLVDAAGEIPSYVVRHLADHLQAAGAPPEAFAPFAQARWRIAWERESDVPGGHLGDVRLARVVLLGADRAQVAAGEPPERVVDTCRCLWAIATASEAVTEVPYALVAQLVRHGLWTPPRALSFARAQPDSDRQASALAIVPPYLDAEGALAGAELLIRALDEAADYPDGLLHAEGLGALVARLASLGHVVTARALTEGLGGDVRALAALELAIAVPDDDDLLAAALRAVQTLDGEIPYWVLEPLIERVPAERAEAALAYTDDASPVAGAAVAWLADRLVNDPTETTIDDLATLAAWSHPAPRRRITEDVLAGAARALPGAERSAAWAAVRRIGIIASLLDCAGLRIALELVQSAQLGYRPTSEEVDLLLRLVDCLQGDERSRAAALALAALPDVLKIGGTGDRNELLARLAGLDPERVLDSLATLPADDWSTGGTLATIATSLDVRRTRRAMDIARGLRWETRQDTLAALAWRLAAFGVAETHEALSVLSGGVAREEQQAALLVLQACATGETVAGSDLMAIDDGDLRAAVMIAASHTGVLPPPAVYAGIRAFGDDERAVDTLAALSATRVSWGDSAVLAALEEVTLHVSYGRKGAVLIPCFANVVRQAGREATLEFAARIGARFPRAGAWVLAALGHLGELHTGDLELAGLAGAPETPLVQMLELNRDLPHDRAFAPSFAASMYAGDWADAVALLPAGAQADAVDTIPEDIWQGPRTRDDTVWTDAVLGLVPILPRERIDAVRDLTPRVGSATRTAARGAAFAIRLAQLGDHAEAFTVARSITRREFSARALAAMVAVIPAAELGTWLATALEHFARRDSRERARTLACALPRLLALEPASLWSLTELWLSADPTRGQLLCDLVTLGPVVQHLAGREAAAELVDWAKRLPA
jgi:hypothetical protein